ncbi:SCO3242 family prenyltransferase [Nonomuraea sp. NPDC049309]|uniref:SCO3242 family prenyltransferase n=1 Tax=Nonomuraea sp. NPDC049309 TaxID=3364350 RepID=UPI00372009EF
MRLRDLADLVRAPAALSVPGDVIAGAAAGQAVGPRTAGLVCSSVCLYWAGMAANDWADRHLDAAERPERPIPSGRVRPGEALAVAAGLTAAGLTVAGLTGGRRALAVAAPLAGAVWAYDLAAKNTRAGPLVMALCRGLNVLLGATSARSPGVCAPTGMSASLPAPRPLPAGRGPGLAGRPLGAAVPAALTVAAHTYLLTELSRGETAGTSPARPAATLAATLALATTAAVPSGQARPSGGATGPAQGALALWYAAQFGRPQARAVSDPSASRVRDAVTAGIVSLPALQGALAARAGRPLAGLALAAAVPLARRLARKVSPT